MRYKLHDGIVYARIKNVFLLIATRDAWDEFPAVKKLSPVYGWFCSGIANGLSVEEILANEKLNQKLPRKTIEKKLEQFIREMTDANYLVMEEECAEQ